MFKIILVLMLVSFSFANVANAIPITLTFTATNFKPDGDVTNPAPMDVVSGTIVYDASSVYSPINSITSIALSISGHAYSVDELGFNSFFIWPGVGIFRSIRGLEGMRTGIDTFSLLWDPTDLHPHSFLFATPIIERTLWYTYDFTEFSLNGISGIPPVPEPSTVLLFGLGLGGIALRRYQKNASNKSAPVNAKIVRKLADV